MYKNLLFNNNIVSLLFLICVSLFSNPLKADGIIPIIDVEIGGMLQYLPETTQGDIEFNPANSTFADFSLSSPLFASAYAFVGYEFFSIPTVSVTVEGLVVIGLLGKSVRLNLDADSSSLDFKLNNAFGLGGKASFGILGIGIYARGGIVRTQLDIMNEEILLSESTITETNLGFYFGVGVKLGLITFGYSNIPGLRNAHMVSVGILL